MTTTRRSFLKQSIHGTAWAGLATSTNLAGGSRHSPAMPIVDTHQHLWDLSVVQPPWLQPGGELTRDYVTQDYLKATAGLNVIKAVYMEVAVSEEQLVTEAEHVIGLCTDPAHPTVAAVIGGRPAKDNFKSYLDRFQDSPHVKGVRHIMRQPKMLQAPGLIPSLRLLGKRGLCFDLCVSPGMLAAAGKLVEACPETRFVIDHCGNADPVAFMSKSTALRQPQHDADTWRRDMDALARHKNTICKISGIVSRLEKSKWSADQLAPPVNHCLDTFGPNRVIFASDWPVCTRGAELREWVRALQEIVGKRPLQEQRKLFAENAITFYGLG